MINLLFFLHIYFAIEGSHKLEKWVHVQMGKAKKMKIYMLKTRTISKGNNAARRFFKCFFKQILPLKCI